jgi:phosphatidylserine/phosphatidylglycerophosphate/cardiolipin synthase-like enzyme
LNTEIGLLIANPEISREVGARFDALTQLDNAYALSLRETPAGIVWTTEEDGKTVESTVEPTRSAWRRWRVKMLSLIPLDKEL